MTANACAEVIRERLVYDTYYLHIADSFGEGRLSGDVSLCVRRRKFAIMDPDQCWQRGLIEAEFFAVDTGGAPNWTVLLSYD